MSHGDTEVSLAHGVLLTIHIVFAFAGTRSFYKEALIIPANVVECIVALTTAEEDIAFICPSCLEGDTGALVGTHRVFAALYDVIAFVGS